MKTVTEAVRSVPLRSLLTGFLPAAAAFLLSGAALDGLYSPWALAAVSAAGVSWPGLSALLGAGLGAFLFLDFQAGLRHTAAAILIFCANTAFCTTRLYRRPVFRPVAAVLMTLLVQSAYLIQRQPRQWALCAAACTVLYAAAALLPSLSDANASAVSRGQALFLLGLGLSLTAYGWSFSGFRVGGMLAAALLMAAAKCLSPAAAFRAVYDSFFTEVSPPRLENPAVLFDRAAEQICAGCLLQRDCWQAHYNDTYNAFNDACPRLLRRGSACAEDFPLHFASRCLHFPQLLEALNDQLHQFLLRRAHRLQLEEAYQVARQQYAQMSEVLSSGVPVSAPPRFACRTSIALRPREGETLCGDQAASFEAGGAACLLLSDGMGSGEAAHREAAMTVRLLKQFLQAGVEPLPALKTLNTAMLLRCREGAGFTTIDLLRLDRSTGEAALYKYGAAPSYLKKLGRVTRYGGAALPAGLEGADRQPDVIRFVLPPDGWLVMVSDGVVGGDGDEWLQDLLAGWGGGTPDALARRILTMSAEHGGRSDDCAVLALHRLRGEENGPAQV